MVTPVFRTAAALTLLFASQMAFAAPQANNDSRTTPQGTPISIDVMNNDFHPDGLAFVIFDVTQPTNGTVTVLDDNAVQYVPNPGFAGQDTFSYRLIDENEDISNAATVSITVTESLLGSGAAAGNDRGVASVLNRVCEGLADQEQLSPGQQLLQQRCTTLALLAGGEDPRLGRILNQIAPEETIAMTRSAAASSQTHAEAVGQRLNSAGQGLRSVSINGLAVHSGPLGGAAGDDFGRAGFFANIQLETADKKVSEWENGFDYSANTLVLGLDYRLTAEWIVGSALGWTKNDLDYKNDDGEVKSTIISGIAFASFNQNHWSTDFQLGYSASDHDISRYIRYDVDGDEVDTRTQGSTAGQQWFVRNQWQYIWSRDALTVFPQASLDYMRSTVDAYGENNAAGFEVELGEQKSAQLTLRLGAQAQYVMNTNWGVWIPQADLTLLSEVHSKKDAIMGRFAFSADDSEVFYLEAEDGDSSFYQAGLGASFIVPNGISGFVRLSHTFGYTDFSASRFEAGVRFEF